MIVPPTSSMRIGRAMANSTRAWPERDRGLELELEMCTDEAGDVIRAASDVRGRMTLNRKRTRERGFFGLGTIEADRDRDLPAEHRLDGGLVDRRVRRALVQHDLDAARRHSHDVAEHRERAARIRPRGDLWRHDDGPALRAPGHDETSPGQ